MAASASVGKTPTANSNSIWIELETDGDTMAENKEAEDTVYITGYKLFLVMTGLTVVMLLAMLDMSIISTVSSQEVDEKQVN